MIKYADVNVTIESARLASVVGSLCCLEIKMGVAVQPTVYKSFSTVCSPSEGLTVTVNTFLAVLSEQNFSFAKPVKHSQLQGFYI